MMIVELPSTWFVDPKRAMTRTFGTLRRRSAANKARLGSRQHTQSPLELFNCKGRLTPHAASISPLFARFTDDFAISQRCVGAGASDWNAAGGNPGYAARRALRDDG